MRFLKNNILTLAALAFVLTMTLTGDAFAASDVMGTAREKGIELFTNVKTIIFVVGGFGLIALAFSAIFGKVKWSWFAGLAFGLAILAAAGAIVDYATGDSRSLTGEFNDSFGSAGGSL